MTASAPALEITNIRAGYGDLTVVWGASVQVTRAEIVILTGRNGAGKTTFVQSIFSTDCDRFSGTIKVGGVDATKFGPSQLVRLGVSLVPEGHRVFPGLTVLENLQVAAYGLLRSRRLIRERAERAIESFPILTEFVKRNASDLSGGQQQMLAIAQGLMADPSVLILDEPTSGLAPVMVNTIYERLRALAGEGLGILLVDQDPRRGLEVCKRAYVMERGLITLQGRSEDLLRNFGSVQSAMQSVNVG